LIIVLRFLFMLHDVTSFKSFYGIVLVSNVVYYSRMLKQAAMAIL